MDILPPGKALGIEVPAHNAGQYKLTSLEALALAKDKAYSAQVLARFSDKNEALPQDKSASAPTKQQVLAEAGRAATDANTGKATSAESSSPDHNKNQQWVLRVAGQNILVESDAKLKPGQFIDISLNAGAQGEQALSFQLPKSSATATIAQTSLEATTGSTAISRAAQVDVLLKAIAQIISQQVPLDLGLTELQRRASLGGSEQAASQLAWLALKSTLASEKDLRALLNLDKPPTQTNQPSVNNASTAAGLSKTGDPLSQKASALLQELVQARAKAAGDGANTSLLNQSLTKLQNESSPSTVPAGRPEEAAQSKASVIKQLFSNSGSSLEAQLLESRSSQESLKVLSSALSALLGSAEASSLSTSQTTSQSTAALSGGSSAASLLSGALDQATISSLMQALKTNNARAAGSDAAPPPESNLLNSKSLAELLPPNLRLKLEQALQQMGQQLKQDKGAQTANASTVTSNSNPASTATSANLFAPQANLKATLVALIGAINQQTQKSNDSAHSPALSHSSLMKAPLDFPALQSLFTQVEASMKADAMLADQELNTGQLLKLLAGMLNRIQFNQLNSLYQTQSGSPETSNNQSWMFEVPVHNSNGSISSLQVRIDKRGEEDRHSTKDENGKKTLEWKITLAFKLEYLGPMYIQVALIPPKVSPVIWCESPKTFALLQQERANLEDQLSALGLEVDTIHCHKGQPNVPKNPIEKGFVDVRA